MCKKQFCLNNVLLQCPVAQYFNVNWNYPGSSNSLICEKYNFFGGKRHGFRRCAMLAVFWMVWMDRNKRIFMEVRVGMEINYGTGLVFGCRFLQ